jgi:hypothetical protein
MSGDGVSLQTTISQMGNVAKTQLKGQQQNQTAAPLSEQIDKSKDLKVNRVQQAEKADKGRVEPDAKKEKDKGKKRRRKRRDRKNTGQQASQQHQGEMETNEADHEQDQVDQADTSTHDELGRHIDTRV